jgi:hypothetical protein
MMTVIIMDDAAKGGSAFAQTNQSLAYPHPHGRWIHFLSITVFCFPAVATEISMLRYMGRCSLANAINAHSFTAVMLW